jgi:hypothetical protein
MRIAVCLALILLSGCLEKVERQPAWTPPPVEQAEPKAEDIAVVAYHVGILRAHFKEGADLVSRNTAKVEKAYKSGDITVLEKALKVYKNEGVQFQDKVAKIKASHLEIEEVDGALDDAHRHLSTIAATIVEVPRAFLFGSSPEQAEAEIRVATFDIMNARIKFEESIASAYKVYGFTEEIQP